MKSIIVLCAFFNAHNLHCADYFWVGNSGNWSDLTHWSSTTGGAGGAYVALPTTADNVFFDANSFTVGGQVVDVDVDASCNDLDFTGVTNSPSIDGAGSITITVDGSLSFVAGMSHDFSGNYNFSSTTVETILSSNQVFNGNILFEGIGGSWSLSDALEVVGELAIQNGTFNMNGMDVTVGVINANNGTALRTIDFSSSTVVIQDGGTSLDLTGNTTNLIVVPGTATIEFTNTSSITVMTGDEEKTIPPMTFSACTGTVLIRTGSVETNTKRITFGDIEVSVNGTGFTVDGNNDNSNIKTYASITLPNNCRYIMGSGDGTGGFGGTNHTIIAGDFIVGNGGEGDVRGRYLEIVGDFVAGEDSDCRFIQATQFMSDFNIESTGGNDIILDNDAEFAGDWNINGDALIRLDNDVNIAGDIILADNSTFTLDNSGTVAITNVLGTFSVGVESIVDIGDGGVGMFTFADIVLASEAQMDVNNSTSTTSIGDLTLSAYNIVRFNTTGANNITGTLSSPGNCDIWLWLKSRTDGVDADVTFSSPQSINTNICQDLNVTTSNLTNVGGVDLSNNTGITFTAAVAGMDFFWVGGTVGNTNTGTFSTGVNDDWSNPDNWSLTSGVYSGTNSCIPGAQDNVFFDANSFNAGAGNVDPNLLIQACNSMTWTGIPAGCTMDAGSTTTNRELIIFGDLTLNGNLDNQFESLITFSAHDATTRVLTSNGASFFGIVEFEFAGGTWSLADNFDQNGGTRADVNFISGNVLANAVVWTIEDDWTVYDGTFTSGTSRVEFDGPASQNTRQEIESNGSDFYDLYVNRGTNGGGANDYCRLQSPIVVNNDLNIIRGGLDDFGNQITGSVFGNMDIENGARILIGRTGFSTDFPTNYITANIDLNETSRTYYNSNLTQTVSNVPDYGRLYVQNFSGATLSSKIMDGPIFVNDLLFINDYNNLIDNGFQIVGDAGEEIQMDPNSQLTLGIAGVSTLFPTNFTTLDINEPSTVVYNSGLDQDVKSIAGSGDARYSNVLINNAAGAGVPVKLLEGDVIIRGNLTINSGNELDVDVTSTFDIELQGNWTNDGVFDEHTGEVSFTGDIEQIMTSGGIEETFYDFIVNNTSVDGVVLEDDISVTNSLTFTDGIVYRGVSGAEVVRVVSGAAVSGASDASHVDGQVEKVGNTAFVFPVGKNGFYRPISIRSPSIAGTGFIAEYFQVDPDPTYDDSALELPLELISSCEYWILDRSNAVLGSAAVTLSWLGATSCGITDIAELRVARWDGTQWTNEGNGGTTGTTAAGDVVSLFAVSDFSPFTLGSTSELNPLPIELLSFDAVLSGSFVDLKWVTASEVNNDYFEIERSADGIDFEKIHTQKGAGNSSVKLVYEHMDRTPLPGISYYRLKQVDYDGSFSYSEIRTINVLSESAVIYPNPLSAQAILNVNLPYSYGQGEFTIYDSSGKLIRSDKATQAKNKLAISELSEGVYFLKFHSEKVNEVYRFVVR